MWKRYFNEYWQSAHEGCYRSKEASRKNWSFKRTKEKVWIDWIECGESLGWVGWKNYWVKKIKIIFLKFIFNESYRRLFFFIFNFNYLLIIDLSLLKKLKFLFF